MTLEQYKPQGHPQARLLPGDKVDDIYTILTEWAAHHGHGLIENGGEFDYDETDRLVYNLYDDDGLAHPFEIEGRLVGEVLEIISIKRA